MSLREPRSASQHRRRYGGVRVGDPVAPCPDQEPSEPSAETLRVELSTEDGLMIPEASFRIRFANGQTRSGTLDAAGVATLQGVPPNTPFEIVYNNPADVRAKALAVRLREGLAQASFAMVAGVLRESATDLAAIKVKFEIHCGPDMIAACRAAFDDENGGLQVRYLLAQAGLTTDATVISYDDER